MYPLHKYVPTPFGTYLMYINHGKERINVENFPKDMTSFKKDLARNPQKFKDKTVKRKTTPKKLDDSHISATEVPPSYQIRFLEHCGQTVTDPPPNVTIVDNVTGAEVTSSMSWIRNRPKRWKERLKLHEIENPKMTSTLEKISHKSDKDISHSSRRNFLPMRFDDNARNFRKIAAPQESKQPDPIKEAMLPHLDKPHHRRRGREKREERDKEAKKRRRRADKIMELVANRAMVAKINSQSDFDKAISPANIKTAVYMRDGVNHRSASVGSGYPQTRLKTQRDQSSHATSELSDYHWKGRATVHEEVKPPRIQDWNPREDQQLLNTLVLERMKATIPYKWGSNEIKQIPQHDHQQQQHYYVL